MQQGGGWQIIVFLFKEECEVKLYKSRQLAKFLPYSHVFHWGRASLCVPNNHLRREPKHLNDSDLHF